MDYITLLKADLEKGYSKSDLERLIGLPKNNLSGILKGDRKLSKKSMLKIEKWEVSEKPNPLELFLEKSYEENKEEIGKVMNDIMEQGVGVSKTDGIKIKRIDPMSEEAAIARYNSEHTDSHVETVEMPEKEAMVLKYETELSTLGDGQFAKARKKWLQNKIKELTKTQQ